MNLGDIFVKVLKLQTKEKILIILTERWMISTIV